MNQRQQRNENEKSYSSRNESNLNQKQQRTENADFHFSHEEANLIPRQQTQLSTNLTTTRTFTVTDKDGFNGNINYL